MASLSRYAITCIATVTVDMKTAGKTNLYTVPAGKVFYPAMVVVRDPSGSLAGGTEYDFGTGVDANTWVQNVDLSSIIATTDFMIISGNNVEYSECAAISEFGIKVITGATGAATAVLDVFGYLI